MNIASVPCRCGHSCTVPGTGPAQSRHVGERGPSVLEHGVGAGAVHGGDHARGLGDDRRAGRVEHHAAGPDQVEGAPDQLALEHHQREQVVRLAPPPRLGTAAQRAQAGAGRVDEHPVEEPARYGGRVPSAATTPMTPGRRRRRRRASGAPGGRGAAAARWRPAVRPARRPAPPAAPALPPGPAHRSSQSSSRPSSGASASASATSCEPSSCTPARPSATAGTAPWVATLEHHAVRRVGGRLPRQLLARGAPGPGHQGDLRVLVVGREQRVQLVLAESVAELVDDPFRVAEGERGVPRRRGPLVGGDLRDPLVEVALADRAQHRVGEVAGPGVHPGAHQVDGGADRGVVGTRIDSSWWVPSRSASSTFDSTFESGRSMQAARIAS